MRICRGGSCSAPALDSDKYCIGPMLLMPTIFAMAAGACLTLALPMLVYSLSHRRALSDLLFSLTALGAAGVALGELATMQATSGEAFVRAMKFTLAPLALLVVCLTWFVVDVPRDASPVARVGPDRGLARGSARELLGTVQHRLRGPPTALSPDLPWGESVMVASAAPRPLKFLGDSLTPSVSPGRRRRDRWLAWRRGRAATRRSRRRRVSASSWGSPGFTSLLGRPRVDQEPYLDQRYAFLGVVLAMGLELTFEAARASDLSRGSEEQRAAMALAPRGRATSSSRTSTNEDVSSYVNPFFTRVTGFSSHEILGQPITRCSPALRTAKRYAARKRPRSSAGSTPRRAANDASFCRGSSSKALRETPPGP